MYPVTFTVCVFRKAVVPSGFWEPSVTMMLTGPLSTTQEPVVAVDGPGLLDVTVWRQQDSMTVHLVNLSNPMAMRGYFREFLPVGPLRLRVRLPQAREARQVRFLVGADTPAVQRQPGFVTLTIPRVLSHEVVAIDL